MHDIKVNFIINIQLQNYFTKITAHLKKKKLNFFKTFLVKVN